MRSSALASPHIHTKPGGGKCLPRLLLVKPDGTFDESLDGLFGDRQARRVELVAQEIEASLDPADEGLVTRAEVRLWLKADIQSLEIEVCLTPNNGHSAGQI